MRNWASVPICSREQIIEYCATPWKIEAGFHEVKQEVGSAETLTRNPEAVTNYDKALYLVRDTLTFPARTSSGLP